MKFVRSRRHKHVVILSRTPEPISIKLGTNHPRCRGFKFVQEISLSKKRYMELKNSEKYTDQIKESS